MESGVRIKTNKGVAYIKPNISAFARNHWCHVEGQPIACQTLQSTAPVQKPIALALRTCRARLYITQGHWRREFDMEISSNGTTW